MSKLLHELAERATEEHPDTIALRECRAELEAAMDPLRESVWAERFKVLTARAEKAESERDAARAELAALTAPLKEGESWERLTYDEGYRDGAAALQAKVARAIPYLERALDNFGNTGVTVDRIHAALKELR